MSKFIEGALRCFSIQSLQAVGEHLPKTHPLYKELEADLTEATRTPPKFPMSEWKKLPVDLGKYKFYMIRGGGAEGEQAKWGYIVLESVFMDSIPVVFQTTRAGGYPTQTISYIFLDDLAYFADEFDHEPSTPEELFSFTGVDPVEVKNLSGNELFYTIVGPFYETHGFMPHASNGTVYQGYILQTQLLSQQLLDFAKEKYGGIVDDFNTVMGELASENL